MVRPVLPGARRVRNKASSTAAQSAAADPAPLFGKQLSGAAQAPPPAAVLANVAVFPALLVDQLNERPDGPVLAPLLSSLFPVTPGCEARFAADTLQSSTAIQDRAAALTAEIAERDLAARIARLADQLMNHAAPGLLARAKRALGQAVPLDAESVAAQIESLKRDLKTLLAPTQRLALQSASVLSALDASRSALELALPWLEPAATQRRLRLLDAAHAGCSLVPAQSRQLLDQLNEHGDRLQTLESATLPALRNALATRRLTQP
jgi:hypothetical protein